MKATAGATLLVLSLAVAGFSEGSGWEPLLPIRGELPLVGVVPVVYDWDGNGSLDVVLSTQEGKLVVLETQTGLVRFAVDRAYALARIDETHQPLPAMLPKTAHGWPARIDIYDTWQTDSTPDIAAFSEDLELLVYEQSTDRRDVLWGPTDGCVGIPLCSGERHSASVRFVNWDWYDNYDIDLLVATDECYIVMGEPPPVQTVAPIPPVFDWPDYWNSEAWCGANSQREEHQLFGLSGYGVVPWAVDWNGDGLLDIVLGYAANTPLGTLGRVLLAANQGTAEDPAFGDPGGYGNESFLVDGTGSPITSGEYAAIAVCDANLDGVWDVLVGGDGPLALYLGQGGLRLVKAWEIRSLRFE